MNADEALMMALAGNLPAGGVPEADVDVDPDEREEADPAAYWHSVRTRTQLDHDVATGVLSPREAAFVVEYTMTPDKATEAAIRAGYAPSGAHVQVGRLLRRERVQNAVSREFARAQARTGIGRDYLVSQARDIVEDSSAKSSDRIKAMELIAKLIGAFAPEEVHHKHSGVSWAEIAAAEDAEYAQVIDSEGNPPAIGDDNLG